MEDWSTGVLRYRSIGVLEDRSVGAKLRRTFISLRQDRGADTGSPLETPAPALK
jgi:hypothetical protein